MIRIGSGAGFAFDRIEPAVELVEKGDINYLVFECLAERTIAIAQKEKLKDPKKGYNSLLEQRIRAVIKQCAEKNIKIISNMGAANPYGAAEKIKEIAKELNIRRKVGVVLGDDIYERLDDFQDEIMIDTGERIGDIKDSILSANVYLGAQEIVAALRDGADIVITGRVADPALYIAPLIYEYNFDMDNYDLLGKATSLGHLLECSALSTGGFFADPGYKDVPGLARLGYPIAQVEKNGDFIITKVQGSGGIVTRDTCKVQLLYELHDPEKYFTPDVTADFSQIEIKQVGDDVVSITGGTGHPKPEKLKVSIGYKDGYIGEGQISYAGSGAYERALLAKEILEERFAIINLDALEMRYDFIGINSTHGSKGPLIIPYEIRLRVAGRTRTAAEAEKIGREVESLYRGPYGGGGVTRSVEEVVAIGSIMVPRSIVKERHIIEEVN